jgi:hypothetical protein
VVGAFVRAAALSVVLITMILAIFLRDSDSSGRMERGRDSSAQLAEQDSSEHQIGRAKYCQSSTNQPQCSDQPASIHTHMCPHV